VSYPRLKKVMLPRPDITPAATDDVPGPDLFMTVIKVRDWAASLAWYVETLGLLPVLIDDKQGFALLAAGNGRLAIQGVTSLKPEETPGGTRLVFLVPDVDAENARLIGRGADVSEPIENAIEGYRELRLHDPDGTPLTLFSWTRPAPGSERDHPPESE
jgi:catechol 2,3-dioxygenase-like lactoylglutathione lyase family enzyme